jgi:alpha-galactosidase
MFKKLGYFVTESSEHFAEYVPWFIKRDRPDLIERFNIPLDEYLRRCEVQIAGWELTRDLIINPDKALDREVLTQRLKEAGAREHDVQYVIEMIKGLSMPQMSSEYGARIIHAIETGEPQVVYGNVMNEGLIDNLPEASCVEVPCLVNKNGIQPTQVGPLPPHLAGLIQTNINVQALTVEAALTGRREHIYHAAMLDPHTAAELDLDQIWDLVDAMLEAHGDWVPAFR